MMTIKAFSQQIYQSKGVAEVLSAMETQYGMNTHILLFCFYSAKMGYGRLKQTQLRQLMAECQNWHEQIVLPLVRLQKSLEAFQTMSAVNELSGLITQDVLLAEYIEQKFLEEVPLSLMQRQKKPELCLQDAGTSVINYLRETQQILSVDAWLTMQVIFNSVFDELTEEHIQALLKKIAYKSQNNSPFAMQRHLVL